MSLTEQILTNEVKADKSPSAQYYLFNKENILTHFCVGYADICNKRCVDSNTTYNAFSVTKTFTALAILQLAEKGLLDLDAPINKFLPDFSYRREITPRQILNHTAGIPNPIPLSWIHLVTEHKDFDQKVFFKRIFDTHSKLVSKPGEKYSYSNLGYVILGQLVESCSQKNYEKYITDNIIAHLPLNANELTYEISEPEKHAEGYHKKMSFSNLILGFFINKSKFMGRTKGKWKPFKPFYVNGASYGGLIGKPIAFVKYIRELLKENSKLISPLYKQQLFQENNKTGMCLSWFTGQLNGVKYFTHAGGGGGYYCEIRIYPDKDLGSVIFFNRTGMTDERYLDKLDCNYANLGSR